MDPISRLLQMGAAGATSAPKVYVEDVFSTWLYTGNDGTQTITNGIDLSGEGGLVWIKGRSAVSNHVLYDTARGRKILNSNTTSAQDDITSLTTYGITSFTSSGFDLGSDWAGENTSGRTIASWTFRKAEKFFDVVTYTGNGTLLTVNHNLGSTPGCIIVKRTNSTGNWPVYHRSLSADATVYLNATGASVTRIEEFGSVSSTTFQVGDSGGGSSQTNANGDTYVAYLFAHDAGGFGDDGNQSVIKCGSYTGNGSSSGPTVTLGWEPQWLLVKRASGGTADWVLFDSMRGVATGGDDEVLYPNLTNAGFSSTYLDFNATGFQLTSTSGTFNASGSDYIYIAIRRGPMKTPEDATKVFALNAGTGAHTPITTNFPVDYGITTARIGSDKYAATRLTGKARTLLLNSTAAEVASADYGFESNTTFTQGDIGAANSPVTWMFRRAPGYFDAVCYTGTGSARTVSHNLGVAPEMMIVRRRDVGNDWTVYSASTGATNFLLFDTGASQASSTRWNNTAPTSSVFTVGTANSVNVSSGTYIAYLFATCPGVSKVGSYTGTGTTKDIDCGFTNGARFVLIKRTDSTGDWYIWDTARSIIAGNDPYLLLNSTAAEVTNTDYIDPLSSGFQISSTAPAAINANGGSFIYLAIA